MSTADLLETKKPYEESEFDDDWRSLASFRSDHTDEPEEEDAEPAVMTRRSKNADGDMIESHHDDGNENDHEQRPRDDYNSEDGSDGSISESDYTEWTDNLQDSGSELQNLVVLRCEWSHTKQERRVRKYVTEKADLFSLIISGFSGNSRVLECLDMAASRLRTLCFHDSDMSSCAEHQL